MPGREALDINHDVARLQEGTLYQPGDLTQDLQVATYQIAELLVNPDKNEAPSNTSFLLTSLSEENIGRESERIKRVGHYIAAMALPQAWDLMDKLHTIETGQRTPELLEAIIEMTHKVHTGERPFLLPYDHGKSSIFSQNTLAGNKNEPHLDSQVDITLPQELLALHYSPVIDDIHKMVTLEDKYLKSSGQMNVLKDTILKQQDGMYNAAEAELRNHPKAPEVDICVQAVVGINKNDDKRWIRVSRSQLEEYTSDSGTVASRQGILHYMDSLEARIFGRPSEQLQETRYRTIDKIARMLDDDYLQTGKASTEPTPDNLALISFATALAYQNASYQPHGGIVECSNQFAEKLRHLVRDNQDRLAHHPEDGLVQILENEISFEITRSRDKRTVEMIAGCTIPGDGELKILDILRISGLGNRNTRPESLDKIIQPVADFPKYARGQLYSSNRLQFCRNIAYLCGGDFSRIPTLEEDSQNKFHIRYVGDSLIPFLSEMWNKCFEKPADSLGEAASVGTPFEIIKKTPVINANPVITEAETYDLGDQAAAQAELHMIGLDEHLFLDFIREYIINSTNDVKFVSKIDSSTQYENTLRDYLKVVSLYAEMLYGSPVESEQVLDEARIGLLMVGIEDSIQNKIKA